MFGQQPRNPVRGPLTPASARSPRRRRLLHSAARLPCARRGLICGLVYGGIGGSTTGHRLPLTTRNDDCGRAETVILAPGKRKVGSSILPLTTNFGLVSSLLTSVNADLLLPGRDCSVTMTARA